MEVLVLALAVATMVKGPFLLALVAAIGPLLAYLGAVRRLSGRIGTSDAAELWKESRAIRADYRLQVAAMQKTIDTLREQVARLEKDNSQLYQETLELKSALIEKLRDRVVLLEDVNQALIEESTTIKTRLKDISNE